MADSYSKQITFLWIDPCPSERLRVAQERLLKSVLALGLSPNLFPAGADLVKFADVLQFAREGSRGASFIWCNSDVTLTGDPYQLEDGKTVRGFHRREVPSGTWCGGVDMYLVPNAVWDEILSRDAPDMWCGATHIDWWLTRAAVLAGCYTAHTGFIDHLSHSTSDASKSRDNPYYRKNIYEYNKWARRNGADPVERRITLPIIGESFSPITDYCKVLSPRNLVHGDSARN